MTSTGPATWAGVVAVIVVAVTVPTVAAAPPTLTVAPVAKFVPVITIWIPPRVEPLAGLTALTVGAGAGGAL